MTFKRVNIAESYIIRRQDIFCKFVYPLYKSRHLAHINVWCWRCWHFPQLLIWLFPSRQKFQSSNFHEKLWGFSLLNSKTTWNLNFPNKLDFIWSLNSLPQSKDLNKSLGEGGGWDFFGNLKPSLESCKQIISSKININHMSSSLRSVEILKNLSSIIQKSKE